LKQKVGSIQQSFAFFIDELFDFKKGLFRFVLKYPLIVMIVRQNRHD